MSTISTLCATSTVALAPCGLALAVSVHDVDDGPLAGHAARQSPQPPPSRMSNVQHDSHSQQSSSSSPGVRSYSSQSRPSSSSKKWFRRLSESFPLSPSSSFFRSSTPSFNTSTGGSRSPSFSFSRPSSRVNTSRPPTRNKLVKRPPSQLMSSRSSSPQPAQQPPTTSVPRPQRRPSTAINQLSTPDRPAHTSHLDLSDSPSPQPSTSVFDRSWRRPTDSPPSASAWHRYFPAKRQKTDPKKPSAIRKIVPDRLRRRAGPTLVLASVVETNMNEATTSGAGGSDAMSVYSELASLYPQSRPVSRHTNDNTETTRPRSQIVVDDIPAMPALPSSQPVRRSFAVANFLARSKSTSTPRVLDEKSSPNTFVGICVGTNGRRFSLSSSAESRGSHSYQQRTRPTTPVIDEFYHAHEQLSVIQSVSRLGLDVDQDDDGGVRLSFEDSNESGTESADVIRPPIVLMSENEARTPENTPRPTYSRPHRLSLMSTSERASTLVGSESEHDFGSDTLFDSIRTRISQLTPVRADAIFDFDCSALQPRSPTYSKAERYLFDDEDATPVRRITSHEASPNSTRTARGLAPTISFDEDDSWSTSDWDAPSRSGDENVNRLSVPGGLRPFSGLLSPSPIAFSTHSNESNTTFGTAQEVLSSASSKETNSVLDWDDGTSLQASSPPHNGISPKVIQALESDVSSIRPSRRLQNYQHFRSQSMPVSKTLRGRVPSENWDDDFLAEEDEGEMVIPHVIQERQASIIGHLGCVREFALLVEDLKRLRDEAISKNIRYGADCLLWDEADGIIALATVDDEDDTQILKREKLQRQHTWAGGQTLEYGTPQKPTHGLHRRSVVLSPGEDIFGHHGTDGPPTPTLEECKQASLQTSAPHWRLVDRNDPIEVAKSMMEKMQQHRAEKLGGVNVESPGKAHFDTDMLKDLVFHVNHLKRELLRVLNTTSPPGLLKVKTFVPDSGMDSQFNFSLTPRHSFDSREGLPNGFDSLDNGAMEFRSTAIGIAS